MLQTSRLRVFPLLALSHTKKTLLSLKLCVVSNLTVNTACENPYANLRALDTVTLFTLDARISTDIRWSCQGKRSPGNDPCPCLALIHPSVQFLRQNLVQSRLPRFPWSLMPKVNITSRIFSLDTGLQGDVRW